MSYPTTILYNNSQSNVFHGVSDANGITEFVADMLKPVGEYILCFKISESKTLEVFTTFMLSVWYTNLSENYPACLYISSSDKHIVQRDVLGST